MPRRWWTFPPGTSRVLWAPDQVEMLSILLRGAPALPPEHSEQVCDSLSHLHLHVMVKLPARLPKAFHVPQLPSPLLWVACHLQRVPVLSFPTPGVYSDPLQPWGRPGSPSRGQAWVLPEVPDAWMPPMAWTLLWSVPSCPGAHSPPHADHTFLQGTSEVWPCRNWEQRETRVPQAQGQLQEATCL